MLEWQNKNDTEWHATARHGSYSIRQFGMGFGLLWNMGGKHHMYLRYDDVEFCKAVAEFHANYINIIRAQEKCRQAPGCNDEAPRYDGEASPKGHPEEQD